MQPGVAAIGLCSWDRFRVLDRYPEVGSYATVLQHFEQAGGTTSNTCAALGRLGVPVKLASRVGDDTMGAALVESLTSAGCDTSMIVRDTELPTDNSEILLTNLDGKPERTIIWFKGAQPRHGDQLPVDTLLDHRWLLIDVNDDRLREFLLSLPAHLSPRTQLAGAMTYLTDSERQLALRHLLAHDVMFGNQRELMQLTATQDLDAAIASIQQHMPGNACRVIFLTLGIRGAVAIRSSHVTHAPAFQIDVADTTGAGDAFAAGALWGLSEGLDDLSILKRGNATGALCCTRLGARDGLPGSKQVQDLIEHGDCYPDDIST